MSEFNLEIVTPDKKFFEGKAEMVIVRGIDGDLAVLKGRTAIATPLKIGKIRVIQGGEERIGSVVDGYITVLNDDVTIVTDAAEWADEIDVDRARAAKERAESRLKSVQTDINATKAEAALKRAINRLEVSKLRKN